MPVPEPKMVRVTDDNDPDRCTMLCGTGKCPYKESSPGSGRCQMHGGNVQEQIQSRQLLRNYRLTKFEQRVSEFADSEGVKSLRDEIGITRMMLEDMINRTTDMQDLLLFAPRINDMISRVERLVVSCHKLEASTGLLLDKPAALALAGKMVEIIGQYVTDPEVTAAIANQIGVAILAIGGSKDEAG